jgi:hypothetical protein
MSVLVIVKGCKTKKFSVVLHTLYAVASEITAQELKNNNNFFFFHYSE